MNLIATRINLRNALFASAALASMLGGTILMSNNQAQAQGQVPGVEPSTTVAPPTVGSPQTYTLGNKSGIGVNYHIQYINQFGQPVREKGFVGFNQEVQVVSLDAPLVIFDSKIGPGFRRQALSLTPGNNNFDRIENFLLLGNGGNLVTPNSAPNSVPNRLPDRFLR